jgi:hypothetical protein
MQICSSVVAPPTVAQSAENTALKMAPYAGLALAGDGLATDNLLLALAGGAAFVMVSAAESLS